MRRRSSIGDFAPEFRDAIVRLLTEVPDLCNFRAASRDCRRRVQEPLVAELVARVSQKGAEGRRSAIYALGRVAQKGRPEVITAVAARLSDNRDAVRLAAVSVLPDIAKRGDREVRNVATTLLNAAEWHMREAALDALGAVARIGDQDTISTVMARLKDADAPVRMAAVRALTEIAPKGDPTVVATVSSHLEDKDASMRQAALSALARVVDKAEKRLIIAIGDRMHDNETWQIRQTAVNTLSQIAKKGDPMVVGAITSKLKDTDWPVRGSAVAALVKVSDDDGALVGCLLELLHDCAPYVRSAVATVLAEIVDEDDEAEVIAALRSRIEGHELGKHETHAMVRRAIAEALESLGEGKVEALLRLAENNRAAIRSISEETPSVEAQERFNEARHLAEAQGNARLPACADATPSDRDRSQPEIHQQKYKHMKPEKDAKPRATGWMARGLHCSLCSKKAFEDYAGLVCQRIDKDGNPISGCGLPVCWRCMAKAPRDTFGSVRTTKEEFEGWGTDAWWMHEHCMTDVDWALYSGDTGGGGFVNFDQPIVPGKPEAEDEEPQPQKDDPNRTVTFRPGRLGLQFHDATGIIASVGDGPAKDAGVEAGWQILTVDKQPFSRTAVENAARGFRSYEIKFTSQAKANATGHTADSVKLMSVKQLKEFLTENTIDHGDCLEKADLVTRALKTVEQMSAASVCAPTAPVDEEDALEELQAMLQETVQGEEKPPNSEYERLKQLAARKEEAVTETLEPTKAEDPDASKQGLTLCLFGRQIETVGEAAIVEALDDRGFDVVVKIVDRAAHVTFEMPEAASAFEKMANGKIVIDEQTFTVKPYEATREAQKQKSAAPEISDGPWTSKAAIEEAAKAAWAQVDQSEFNGHPNCKWCRMNECWTHQGSRKGKGKGSGDDSKKAGAAPKVQSEWKKPEENKPEETQPQPGPRVWKKVEKKDDSAAPQRKRARNAFDIGGRGCPLLE